MTTERTTHNSHAIQRKKGRPWREAATENVRIRRETATENVRLMLLGSGLLAPAQVCFYALPY